MADPKKFLTVGEVAKLIEAPTRSVRRWCESGAIASTRTPGGRREYRIPLDALRERADLLGYAVGREAEFAGF